MFALLFGLVCGPAVACNPEDSSIGNGCRDGELAAAIIGGICGGILLLCFIACMCKGCDKEEVPCEYRLLMVIFWPLVMLYGCWCFLRGCITVMLYGEKEADAPAHGEKEAAAIAKEEKEAREEARGRNEEALARELELAERGMPISVRMLNGKQLYFVVSDRDTVAQLKELIEKRVQIPEARQKLRAPGAANDGELEDDRSCGSFNHGTELHLAVGAGADAADDEGEEAHGGGGDDEGTPLGRIAVCEEALLGQAGTGAMVPRLRAIEEIALGAAGAGALPDRIAAVEAAIGLARAAPLIASDPTPALAPSNVAPADGAGDDDDAAVTLTVEDGASD